MIYNTFELHQEGSLPGAHLVTYIRRQWPLTTDL